MVRNSVVERSPRLGGPDGADDGLHLRAEVRDGLLEVAELCTALGTMALSEGAISSCNTGSVVCM